MVWGGALGLAPADDKIIQVERLINLDPDAQLIASIMAKKIAVGSKYILIEIPYGKYAKVDKKKALRLKKNFEQLARYFKIKLKCLLSRVEQTSGDGIGPALEIKDVIRVLKRESPCFLLEFRSLQLAAELLELTGICKKGQGFNKAKEILDSGKAFNKFKEIIIAQKGNLNSIKEASFSHTVHAKKDSKILEINVKRINAIARTLGCPLDKYAGIYLHKHAGQSVKKNEEILTLYAESEISLKDGINFYNKNNPLVIK
jgi:AMP phosphorylase